MDTYINKYDINLDSNTLVIYGEWAGKGINNKVAINQLDKSFFGFSVRVKPMNKGLEFNDSNDEEREYPSTWLPIDLVDYSSARIFNMNQFTTYEHTVDFSYAEKSIIYFNEVVDDVEEECPVASSFGFKGVGEGVVWSASHNGIFFMFKTKGEKHTKSRVVRVRSVDPVKMKSREEFVNAVITEERVKKGVENGANGDYDMKSMGLILKWVMKDVHLEESDTLEASGLTSKDVSSMMAVKIKEFFFKMVKEESFK